ncbi:hypothetical protein ABIE00_000420 [Arthrobacter sp. OAP107]
MVLDAKGSGEAHPEWTLMYRMGLSRKKIAELARVKVSAVTAHVTAVKAADPVLKTDHRAAAAAATSQAAPGTKRMYQLLAVVEATGRYPSRNAEDKAERELAQWLRRRRRDADAGILNPVIAAGLSVLPDWRRKPREAREDEKWRDHLQRLAAYLAAGNPWPRTTPGVTGPEKASRLRSGRIQVRALDLRSGCALKDPAVAVRVAEEGELHPSHVLDLADAGAAVQQLGAHRVDVGHDELQPLQAPRCHTGHASADDDRGSGTGRCQLHHPHAGDVLHVVVQDKAQLLHVERLRRVNVGYRHLHNFEAHLHAPTLPPTILRRRIAQAQLEDGSAGGFDSERRLAALSPRFRARTARLGTWFLWFWRSFMRNAFRCCLTARRTSRLILESNSTGTMSQSSATANTNMIDTSGSMP